ncbi:hypothetical protein AVEN_4109-1 [Araneus ventricosus]|uniref:Uncharacterized protein n=1 Tax=Araneus ventricosus TaxID=182803 RepID=A0A4Y2VQE1_ARAVE|nr:hypothetical protein AVEN_4109-1 [Araneus ventricosus]
MRADGRLSYLPRRSTIHRDRSSTLNQTVNAKHDRIGAGRSKFIANPTFLETNTPFDRNHNLLEMDRIEYVEMEVRLSLRNRADGAYLFITLA